MTGITINDIINGLELEVICGEDRLSAPVEGAYASDLLSDVMGRARAGSVWITLQTHQNIIAVASLRELPAILIVNNGQLHEDTIMAAVREGIVLLRSVGDSFQVCGRLYQLMQQHAMV
jgi:hypothetical protein